MPSAFAASAAIKETLPLLFSPSVSSTTTFDLDGSLRSRFAHIAMAEPIAVPSSIVPVFHALEVLLEPIMIQRERAYQVGCAGEFHQAEPVVRPLVDELGNYLFHNADAVHWLIVHLEVLRLHGPGNVQREHHVDAAGVDLRRGRARTAAAPAPR